MTAKDLTIGLRVKIGDAFARVHSLEGNVHILVSPQGGVTRLGERMVSLFCVPVTEADYPRLFAEEQNVRDNGQEPYLITVDKPT